MLEEAGVSVDATADARKQTMRAEEVWQLVQHAGEVVIGKGKKVLRLQPRQAGKEVVLAELLGRSGTLRAPALQLGERFLIGWSEVLYAEYFPLDSKK